MKRFTEEQKNAALVEIKQGKLNAEEIARKYKMSKATVQNLKYSQTQRHGIPGIKNTGKNVTMLNNLNKRKNMLIQGLKSLDLKIGEYKKEIEFINKQLEAFEAFYK